MNCRVKNQDSAYKVITTKRPPIPLENTATLHGQKRSRESAESAAPISSTSLTCEMREF